MSLILIFNDWIYYFPDVINVYRYDIHPCTFIAMHVSAGILLVLLYAKCKHLNNKHNSDVDKFDDDDASGLVTTDNNLSVISLYLDV